MLFPMSKYYQHYFSDVEITSRLRDQSYQPYSTLNQRRGNVEIAVVDVINHEWT